MVVRITIRRVGALALNEVAPPGWGHTKAEKEKTKPDKPKSKIGGSAAAFDRARKEGRFKGSKADMFKLMWWMKNKGGKPKGKPHYKPGTDEKYKKYQDKNEEVSYKQRDKELKKTKKAMDYRHKTIHKGGDDDVNETLTPMKDNNLFGNAYAGSYETLKKKIGSKKKHDKPAIKEASFKDYMAQAQDARDRLKKKIEDRKQKDAQFVDTKTKGVRFYDKKGSGRIKSGKKIYDKQYHLQFNIMTDLGLDASQETRITVMQLKIERLEEKQDELRERLKVVEKWVIGAAAVLAAGTTVIGFATNISKAYL